MTIYIDMPTLIKKVQLALQLAKHVENKFLLVSFNFYNLFVKFFFSLVCYLVLIHIMIFTSFISKLLTFLS